MTEWTNYKLAEKAHEAEDTNDDLMLMAVDAEIERRDAQVPKKYMPVSGTAWRPTPNRDEYTRAYRDIASKA